MLLLLFLPALAAEELERSVAWGEFRVVLWRVIRDEDAPYLYRHRLVLEKYGLPEFTLEDEYIHFELHQITGEGPPELVIQTFSGGAHCCFTAYVYTQDPGELVNLHQGDWRSGGIRTVKDLDQDGKDEIVFLYSYDYLDRICFACSPGVIRVFAWEKGRFVDATPRFPERTEKLMKEAYAEIKQAHGDWKFGAAATYWINAYALGRGEEAWRRLEKELSPELMARLERNRIKLLLPFSDLPSSESY